MVTRRVVLAGSAGLVAAAGSGEAAPAPQPRAPFDVAAIEQSLAACIALGAKPSGSAADIRCGEWLEQTLAENGFRTQRQTYDAPWFEPAAAQIVVAGATLPVLPLAPVIGATVSGPLAPQHVGATTPRGAIAVATLPYARWSTSATPLITSRIEQAARDDAAALLLVTTGPTGEALALNADPEKRWPLPVAVLAPKHAEALRSVQSARYEVRGAGGKRAAFNVVGRLARPGCKRIVISTPRSAWTIAAGERGGGIAVWRALAGWAPQALPGADITMLATSGHEYENLGGERFLKSDLAPRPADTHLWVHLGANVASRDWHELGARLLPLRSVDPQRFLVATPNLTGDLNVLFRGAPGMEQVYPAAQGAAGELGNILAAGYPRAFGMFGAHRHHHAVTDDARCIDAEMVLATGIRVRDALARLAI